MLTEKQLKKKDAIYGTVGELLEGAIIDGIVEGNNDGISIQKNGTGDS